MGRSQHSKQAAGALRSLGPLVFIVAHLLAQQTSCQTTATTAAAADRHHHHHHHQQQQQQQRAPTSHEYANRQHHRQKLHLDEHEASQGQWPVSKCNHHQQRHEVDEHNLETAQVRQHNRHLGGRRVGELQPVNARQQRQFQQARSASMTMAALELPQGAGPTEEFSLAAPSPALPPAAELMASASSGQPASLLAPPPLANDNLTGSGYAMLAEQQAATVASTSQGTSEQPTTVANKTDQVAAAGTTTKATAPDATSVPTGAEQLATTTPTLSGDTLSAPSVQQQQPATTTSASANPATSPTAVAQQKSQQQQQQQTGTRQQGRRMEEASTYAAAERHSSSGQAPDSEQQAKQQHAISSSPSSISIITPLLGPPNQSASIQPTHQQQQQQQQSASSSMMKPIYVLGNPIGELDYTSTTYEQARQRAAAATSSQPPLPTGGQRAEKRVDDHYPHLGEQQQQQQQQQASVLNATLFNGDPTGERMNGPALVYSDGRLVGLGQSETSGVSPNASSSQQPPAEQANGSQPAVSISPLAPRLFQNNPGGAAVLNNNPRRPSLPPPVNQEKAASGFRSPLSASGPLIGQSVTTSSNQQQQQPPVSNSLLQQPANNLNQNGLMMPNFYQTSPPYGGGAAQLFAANMATANQPALTNKQAFLPAASQQQSSQIAGQMQLLQQSGQLQQQQSQQQQQQQGQIVLGSISSNGTNYQSRRPLNITRVEHISAECSNDLIRAVIVFNGTFKGIIYSSGYVNDPTCLYVNGSGLTRYEFSIRLNQCGTLGREQVHQPAMPGEGRRRDQVMWNTLSIQYNPVIEQEWDEHFRVSCEYGSDFWKTISFSPFNVETNTGSPVVFTINPPQCQMDVLLGHGMGPKIAVDGPVTVGDPLTLLIHMKSEKAGYDILVKNCVAHNGGKQRMQLIDINGCVVNERFISPFRGTYNDNDLRHVTLYAYLKAFRFTGSPVLYLECEIHMCQSACPPQMCYWRRLSKRSVDNNDFEYTDEREGANSSAYANTTAPVISDSLSLFKALQVRHEPQEPARARQRAQALQEIYAEDEEAQLVCYRHAEVLVFMVTLGSLLLLLLSVALTCFLRIRKLSSSNFKQQQQQQQFQHGRLVASASPSLLSVGGSDALSAYAPTQADLPHRKQTTSWHQLSAANNKMLFHHSPNSFVYDQ